MTQQEYQQQFSPDDAVGWLSIDAELEKLYPGQKPKHFAPPLHYIAGGSDPLDGISVYESNRQADHFHFVTYGFSSLYYDEKGPEATYSKFGFELTFRLKRKGSDDNINWPLSLLQNIARYVFNSGKWFEEFHFIPVNGGLCQDYDTDLTALAFIIDPELGVIKTPNGEVQFLQIVGLTTAEYEQLRDNPLTTETEKIIKELRKDNALLITDLDRK